MGNEQSGVPLPPNGNQSGVSFPAQNGNQSGVSFPAKSGVNLDGTSTFPASNGQALSYQQNISPFPLNIMSSSYGNHLVDSRGYSLYIYTLDNANVSNCSGDCIYYLSKWPPLLPN